MPLHQKSKSLIHDVDGRLMLYSSFGIKHGSCFNIADKFNVEFTPVNAFTNKSKLLYITCWCWHSDNSSFSIASNTSVLEVLVKFEDGWFNIFNSFSSLLLSLSPSRFSDFLLSYFVLFFWNFNNVKYLLVWKIYWFVSSGRFFTVFITTNDGSILYPFHREATRHKYTLGSWFYHEFWHTLQLTRCFFFKFKQSHFSDPDDLPRFVWRMPTFKHWNEKRYQKIRNNINFHVHILANTNW